MTTTFRGKVKRWNAARGFGFIACPELRRDIFGHVYDLQGGIKSLDERDEVCFSLGVSEKTGKEQARNIVLLTSVVGGAP
jgi:cold shock CspA family protein